VRPLDRRIGDAADDGAAAQLAADFADGHAVGAEQQFARADVEPAKKKKGKSG
jgi:hypothetical protein